MLLCTLPQPPGLAFEVKGMVAAQGVLAVGGAKVAAMMDSLAEQAEQLGADAVVDVRTTLAATSGHCVMTGTAVRTVR
ncbi:MAG: heavy metal-binding domain-containing protein [Motilibacteraceae bacterium]